MKEEEEIFSNVLKSLPDNTPNGEEEEGPRHLRQEMLAQSGGSVGFFSRADLLPHSRRNADVVLPVLSWMAEEEKEEEEEKNKNKKNEEKKKAVLRAVPHAVYRHHEEFQYLDLIAEILNNGTEMSDRTGECS